MKNNLELALKRYFNYNHFRPGQKEIITDVLKGKDVLGILPTGSGKSLCYQLPSLLLPYLTIVISPLISLMIDQVRETKAFHFKEVVALHSMLSLEERNHILHTINRYKIVYISPELIQNESIIDALLRRKLSLVVIDEAHCISQWGHDFRPDYLRLKGVLDRLNNPPLLLLSGTLTEEVEKDILLQLNQPQIHIHKYRQDRENIALVVERILKDQSKQERLIEIINQFEVPTIIYFSSRSKAEEIANLLNDRLNGKKVAFYHGGLDHESRLKIQQQFMYNQLHIVCATSAFGMGINKGDIQLVIHYHIPTQKESFVQEIGRAGRDGNDSVSVLLYEEHDEHVPLTLIKHELPTEEEIRRFADYLLTLHHKKLRIISTDSLLADRLSMEDTKIKFLKFQFETNEMISEDGFIVNEGIWEQKIEKINQFCKERALTKTEQLNRLLNYVHTKACLRKELYKDFQEEEIKQTNRCCSSCGYILETKRLEHQTIDHERNSWQKQLAFRLGIEV